MIYSEHIKQVIASERKKYIIVLFTDKTGLRGTAGIGIKILNLTQEPHAAYLQSYRCQFSFLDLEDDLGQLTLFRT
jgi:hypothetical protein